MFLFLFFFIFLKNFKEKQKEEWTLKTPDPKQFFLKKEGVLI